MVATWAPAFCVREYLGRNASGNRFAAFVKDLGLPSQDKRRLVGRYVERDIAMYHTEMHFANEFAMVIRTARDAKVLKIKHLQFSYLGASFSMATVTEKLQHWLKRKITLNHVSASRH